MNHEHAGPVCHLGDGGIFSADDVRIEAEVGPELGAHGAEEELGEAEVELGVVELEGREEI